MSATLHELSSNIAELVAAAGDQIVRVEGRRRLAATGVVYRSDALLLRPTMWLSAMMTSRSASLTALARAPLSLDVIRAVI